MCSRYSPSWAWPRPRGEVTVALIEGGSVGRQVPVVDVGQACAGDVGVSDAAGRG